MFCNRCGTEMQSGFEACPKCGRRIGDPVSGGALSRLERHLRTLGILWMVIGGLFLVPAVGLLVFGSGAFRASSPRAPGWPFPCTPLHCERNSGDSGRGRAVRRNGADAETAVGADGSDHSGSAGLVSSTAGNGAGSVHAVGAAGRRAGRGVQVFQWGRQYLVTSPERKWSGCARRTAESGCPYIVRNMSKNDL